MIPQRLRTLAVTSLATASLFAAGCGGSEEDKVEDTVRDFASAAKDKDFGGICDKLTDASKEQIEKAPGAEGDCEATFEKLGGEADFGAVPDPDDIEFDEVTVDGDKATVKIKGEDNESELVKEDGEWKADLGAGE